MKRLLAACIMICFLGACEKDMPPEISDCLDPSQVDEDAICTYHYQPVCGCDGKTYGNECVAHKAGVLEWTEGACED